MYQVLFLKSSVWHNLGLKPGLPVHWRTHYPLGQWAGYKYTHKYTLSLKNEIATPFYHKIVLHKYI